MYHFKAPTETFSWRESKTWGMGRLGFWSIEVSNNVITRNNSYLLVICVFSSNRCWHLYLGNSMQKWPWHLKFKSWIYFYFIIVSRPIICVESKSGKENYVEWKIAVIWSLYIDVYLNGFLAPKYTPIWRVYFNNVFEDYLVFTMYSCLLRTKLYSDKATFSVCVHVLAESNIKTYGCWK
jgi:hypothetical protein